MQRVLAKSSTIHTSVAPSYLPYARVTHHCQSLHVKWQYLMTAGAPNSFYSTTVTSGGGQQAQGRYGRDQYGYPGQGYSSGGYGNGVHQEVGILLHTEQGT